MMYWDLIIRSKEHFRQHPVYISTEFNLSLFSTGAQWMFDRLKELGHNPKADFDYATNYNAYGWLKYAFCGSAFLVSAILLSRIHFLLTPVAVLVFYFFEIHFLFLFPLLIDQVERPIRASIRLTYRIGVLRAMLTVMPIAFYMLRGLFWQKRPFHHWHIGSMAILLWYTDEIRNRI